MNTQQHPTALQALERIVSYLADLNGSEWIKGDSPAERDMRQRAKALQSVGFTALQQAREAAPAVTDREALAALRHRYGRLHDALSECIEAGRLSAATLPEDYSALVQLLTEGSAADQRAAQALANDYSRADAQIRAAAPEMLAALHEALDEVDAAQADGYEPPAWAATARAAVAKAAEGMETRSQGAAA